MYSSLVALIISYSWFNLSIEINLYAQHLDKYYKLPLNMQRPIMSNELRKRRYATCKLRKSNVIWLHAYT